MRRKLKTLSLQIRFQIKRQKNQFLLFNFRISILILCSQNNLTSTIVHNQIKKLKAVIRLEFQINYHISKLYFQRSKENELNSQVKDRKE